MPAVVGVNCDMSLFHAEVDAGEPFGFLCEAKVKYGPPVTVHWEVYSDALGALSEVRHMWCTILIGDDLVNPDGSKHTETGAQMYAKLIEIAMKHTGIGVITKVGAMTGLKSSGHVMVQNIYPDIQTVVLSLTTHLTNFQPVDPALYMDSKWVDSTTYVGSMHWNNSYWRGMP
jgi:hypothetical protein